jgi:AcrR family transcriptional regulator
MSEVAERAGASIGSLYQFFPNKEAVTEALCSQHAREIEALWAPLAVEAKTLDVEHLVDRLIDVTVEFANNRPAFLALLDAPPATRRRPSAIRQRFRELVAAFFLARRPRMSKTKAIRTATVTLRIVNALMVLYKEANRREKPYIVQEFKLLLSCYLTARIEGVRRSNAS